MSRGCGGARSAYETPKTRLNETERPIAVEQSGSILYDHNKIKRLSRLSRTVVNSAASMVEFELLVRRLYAVNYEPLHRLYSHEGVKTTQR